MGMRHKSRSAGLAVIAVGLVLWAALQQAPASMPSERLEAAPSSTVLDGPVLADIEQGEACDEIEDGEACGELAPPLVEPADTPSRGIAGGGGSGGDGGKIRASRLFAGPGQFPPEAFAAYGIVAFRARASSGERDRYLMLCEAYVAALPRRDELDLPDEEQMVTVWPIADNATADALNEVRGPDSCATAVDRYGLATSLQAIRDAGDDRVGRDRRGPFLLAWSPSSDKGKPDALMLVADLTDVTTYPQAEALFVLWRDDIEANPDYWDDGWDVEQLRLAIRLWVDRYGSQIFTVLGG
jgi:hypothetical protein